MINVIDKKYYQLKYKIFYNKKKKKIKCKIYFIFNIFSDTNFS